MSSVTEKETTRRDFLYIATAAMGVVGAGGVVVPFVAQMAPDAGTRAAGAPIEVDLSPIAEGQAITITWRGQPIFIRHRTAAEIEAARKADTADLRDPVPDAARVGTFAGRRMDQWLVVQGACTHLGCIPVRNAGDYQGWFCPCHGSHFDTAGRIRKGPAPKNLVVPQFEFLADNRIRINSTRSA